MNAGRKTEIVELDVTTVTFTWLKRVKHVTSWKRGKHVTTIMDKGSWDTARKRPVLLNACLQFWHFEPLSPFQCCNHVKVSMERIATLIEKGEKRVGYRQTKCFLKLRRTPIDSVCFAQMCQHFCPWRDCRLKRGQHVTISKRGKHVTRWKRGKHVTSLKRGNHGTSSKRGEHEMSRSKRGKMHLVQNAGNMWLVKTRETSS